MVKIAEDLHQAVVVMSHVIGSKIAVQIRILFAAHQVPTVTNNVFLLRYLGKGYPYLHYKENDILHVMGTQTLSYKIELYISSSLSHRPFIIHIVHLH